MKSDQTKNFETCTNDGKKIIQKPGKRKVHSKDSQKACNSGKYVLMKPNCLASSIKMVRRQNLNLFIYFGGTGV